MMVLIFFDYSFPMIVAALSLIEDSIISNIILKSDFTPSPGSSARSISALLSASGPTSASTWLCSAGFLPVCRWKRLC